MQCVILLIFLHIMVYDIEIKSNVSFCIVESINIHKKCDASESSSHRADELSFIQKGELSMEQDFQKTANRVTSVSIIGNLILSAFKFIAGVVAHSGAMISDAVHSASDVFSSIVVIIGIHVSSKDSDKEHPYGHERLECVAAIILATILCITGLSIGYSAVRTILAGDYKDLAVPGILALVAVNALLFIMLRPFNIVVPAILPVFYLLPSITLLTTYGAYPVIEKYMIKTVPADDNDDKTEIEYEYDDE